MRRGYQPVLGDCCSVTASRFAIGGVPHSSSTNTATFLGSGVQDARPHAAGLYDAVAHPTAALNVVFNHTMHLVEGYGRSTVGAPQTLTTNSAVVKCQRNVAQTFPMTTCFWTNYGAIGVVDFFPPAGDHVPFAQAASQTRSSSPTH